jgi:opacity protein-like surface antigen
LKVSSRVVDALRKRNESDGPLVGKRLRRRLAFLPRWLPRSAVRPVARVGLAIVLIGITARLASRADDTPPLLDGTDPTDWGGFYIGAGAGFGSGSATSTQDIVTDGIINPAQPATPSSSHPGGLGALVGGELGYRWQAGRWVFGVGGAFSYGSVGGSASQSGTFANAPFAATQKSTIKWASTARGSVGYSPADNLLVYATGGIGIGEVTNKASVDFATERHSGTRTLLQPVWVAGAGVEYKVSDNWSAKLEYLHEGFGAASNVSPDTLSSGVQYQSKFTVQADTVLIGMNYTFGGANGSEPDRTDSFAGSYSDQYFSELEYELGSRFWLSQGSFAYKLGGETQAPLVSQLNYDGVGAKSAEVFWRVGHPAGPFLKGYLGIGVADTGSLTDQDFPPGINPYSRTNSSQSDGSIAYGAVDVGYDVLSGDGWRAGPFVGYGFLRDQMNAYGCSQTASNPNICGNHLSPSVLAISEDATWNFVRVGVAGEVTLMPGLLLSGDFAWVPIGGLSGADTHWLRSDITAPTRQSGGVDGVQLEAALRYRFKDWLDVGVGGRYWQLNSRGNSLFQGAFGRSQQDTKFSTERYGPFVQVNVKL